jgi:hypothetical protein
LHVPNGTTNYNSVGGVKDEGVAKVTSQGKLDEILDLSGVGTEV